MAPEEHLSDNKIGSGLIYASFIHRECGRRKFLDLSNFRTATNKNSHLERPVFPHLLKDDTQVRAWIEVVSSLKITTVSKKFL